MKQRDIFLFGEGDQWFNRNKDVITSGRHFVISSLLLPYLTQHRERDFRFLEVGCGLGNNTFEFARNIKGQGFGIDPSSLSVQFANSNFGQLNNDEYSTTFKVGSSDDLKFPSRYFNLVYFGFCLYLVDRDLLEKSIHESIRVLKSNGFIAILDFDFGGKHENIYIHDVRINSYKDDYYKYFVNEGFEIVSKTSLLESGEIGFHPDKDKRIAFYLLRNTIR